MSQCLAESLSLGTGLPGGQGSGKGKPSEANGEVGRWGPQARPSSHFGCPLGKHDLAGPPCIGCLYKEGLKSVEKGWLTSSASKCGENATIQSLLQRWIIWFLGEYVYKTIGQLTHSLYIP